MKTRPFIILCKARTAREAGIEAEREYNRYIPLLFPYVDKIERVLLTEMYAHEGMIGYLIRIELKGKQ